MAMKRTSRKDIADVLGMKNRCLSSWLSCC